ncbi:hypothetical protein HYPSUDRAFT_108311, partial [Hypholoma sublateritium FD-334 SS-4]
HNFPIDPTPDTLSFFVVYMCHPDHVKPNTVKSYLSGICNQLEIFFPNVREARRSQIVTRTLTGCTKLRAVGVNRKRAITFDEIGDLHTSIANSSSYDDSLFLAICHSSFHGLLRIGESVWPDKRSLQDYHKVVPRSSVALSDATYEFTLPGHKAVRLFEGSRVLYHRSNVGNQCMSAFASYLARRDAKFPYNPELWLREDGSIPQRSWFMRMLRRHFTDNPGGHSFRPGGATYLASLGVPPNIIQ